MGALSALVKKASKVARPLTMETSRSACGGCALRLICCEYFFQAIQRGFHPASLPGCPPLAEHQQAQARW